MFCVGQEIKIITDEVNSYYEKNSRLRKVNNVTNIDVVSSTNKKYSPCGFLSKSTSYKLSSTPKVGSTPDVQAYKRINRNTVKKPDLDESISKLRRSRKLRTRIREDPIAENENDEHDNEQDVSNEIEFGSPTKSSILFDINPEQTFSDALAQTHRVSQTNSDANSAIIEELGQLKHKLKSIFQSFSKQQSPLNKN